MRDTLQFKKCRLIRDGERPGSVCLNPVPIVERILPTPSCSFCRFTKEKEEEMRKLLGLEVEVPVIPKKDTRMWYKFKDENGDGEFKYERMFT